MEIIGYILSIIIGLTLGLFGAGGAIISFPVLMYFMNIPPLQASVYSLLIVGISAFIAVIQHIKNKNIDIKITIIFSVPLLISFYIFKFIILPIIPQDIISFSQWTFTKNHLIILLFIITLSIIIYRMLYNTSASIPENTNNLSTPNILSYKYIISAGLVGMLAASIGAGGGFIIVPALIEIFKLPIKKATGTSLFIISINSFVGTIMNIKAFQPEHTTMLLLFSILSIAGIFIGTYLNKILQSQLLKTSYAYFLVFILFSTIITEIYKFTTNHQ